MFEFLKHQTPFPSGNTHESPTRKQIKAALLKQVQRPDFQHPLHTVPQKRLLGTFRKLWTPRKFSAKTANLGISLVVQWLRLCLPNGQGLGSIPDQGIRSHMPQLKTPHAHNED